MDIRVMKNKSSELIGTTTIGLMIILSALGYYIYNKTLDGAFGMILFFALCSLFVFIMIVPFFIGSVFYFMLGIWFVMPWGLSVLGLYATWLTWTVFVVIGVVGCIINILVSLVVLSKMLG